MKTRTPIRSGFSCYARHADNAPCVRTGARFASVASAVKALRRLSMQYAELRSYPGHELVAIKSGARIEVIA